MEAISAEIDPRYAAIPTVLVGTGPTPGGAVGAGTPRPRPRTTGSQRRARLHARRAEGLPAKSSRQRRRVPLRRRVVEALQSAAAEDRHAARCSPPREAATSTGRSSATATGRPALRAAGHRPPPRLRLPPHVRIAGRLARRRRGCSYSGQDHGDEQSRSSTLTYGHLLGDSEDYLRGLLDAYDDVYGLSADLRGRLERRNRLQIPKMRMRGLEPPRGCPHTDLNRARLPIPPHPRGGASVAAVRRRLPGAPKRRYRIPHNCCVPCLRLGPGSCSRRARLRRRRARGARVPTAASR